MSTPKPLSRRQFLSHTSKFAAASIAAPYFVPAHVLGAPGRPGANDRVNIAYIALGRRARQLMSLPKGTEIVACSDVDKRRMDSFTKSSKGRNARAYQDYRELLAQDDVDAIITATPDHWHAKVSIDACNAGKDVYVEKPMTLTILEGRLMVEAARKNKRIVQVGSQQRSMAQNLLGCELIRNGRIGKVHTVHGANYPSPWECELSEQPVPEGLDWDMWFGRTEPRPYHIDLFLPRAEGRHDEKGRRLGWISYRPWSGGEITGWGAHGIDQIQWALGMDESGPVEMWPELDGWKGPKDWPEGRTLTCPVTYRYADGALLKLDGKGGGGGGLFEGEEGSINIDRAKVESRPRTIVEEPIKDTDTRLYKSENHMENWVECIRSREMPIADVEIGHRSTTVCHLGNIARWTGRKLTWDPETETFPGDDDANAYLQRPMREPWTL